MKLIAGFRRAGFPNALTPDGLCAMLTQRPSDGDPPLLDQKTALALRCLDALADATKFLRVSRYACDELLAFALALDVADNRARMRAILIRAYERADEYAFAVAQAREDAAAAKAYNGAIGAALTALAGEERPLLLRNTHGLDPDSLLAELLGAVGRYRREEAEALEDRRDRIVNGIIALKEAQETCVAMAPDVGRPTDEPRFFLALRLCEIFTVATGVEPQFNKEINKRDLSWKRLLETSLQLCGLLTENEIKGTRNGEDRRNRRTNATGAASVAGGLAERLGGHNNRVPTSAADGEHFYEGQLKNMAEWLRSRSEGEPLGYGNLLSAGREIDYGLPETAE